MHQITGLRETDKFIKVHFTHKFRPILARLSYIDFKCRATIPVQMSEPDASSFKGAHKQRNLVFGQITSPSQQTCLAQLRSFMHFILILVCLRVYHSENEYYVTHDPA